MLPYACAFSFNRLIQPSAAIVRHAPVLFMAPIKIKEIDICRIHEAESVVLCFICVMQHTGLHGVNLSLLIGRKCSTSETKGQCQNRQLSGFLRNSIFKPRHASDFAIPRSRLATRSDPAKSTSSGAISGLLKKTAPETVRDARPVDCNTGARTSR